MRPLVTAHSGCENTTPNSIESFEAAVLGKADTAEIDIRISKDRIPVLSHDGSWFTGTEEAALSISDSRSERLKGIVTLREILEIAAESNICLNLDIKDFSAVDEVMKLLKSTGTDRKSVFSGYSPDQVIKLRNIYSGLCLDC